MSTIDSIWGEMQYEETKRKEDYSNRYHTTKKKSDISSLTALMSGNVESSSSTKPTLKISKNELNSSVKLKSKSINKQTVTIDYHSNLEKTPLQTTLNPSDQSVLARSTAGIDKKWDPERLKNILQSNDSSMKLKGLKDLLDYLQSSSNSISPEIQAPHISVQEYNTYWNTICKAIYALYIDSKEKIREYALKITSHFYQHCSDFSYCLGYYFPILMTRLPSGHMYDEKLNVFVNSIEDHEAYLRGRCVSRQDKLRPQIHPSHITATITNTNQMNPSSSSSSSQSYESSETIRLLHSQCIRIMLQRLITLQSITLIQPYFHDLILCIQYQVNDDYSDILMEICTILQLLSQEKELNHGMKYFAVGLVRVLLPLLRHKHAKIRTKVLHTIHLLIMIPDRDKRKGAGSDAIMDLVGFQESNMLSINSFYQPTIQFNYLASLVIDTSIHVKQQLVTMIIDLLVVLEDRYDHQTRLLPYLLTLLTDSMPEIAQQAYTGLLQCGQLYEQDHYDEILEKKQYGLDSDEDMNLSLSLPPPFSERPPISVRLFIGDNIKRFLQALIQELTNWQNKTRYQSAALFKLLIILCEKALTVDIHIILPALLKALHYTKMNQDILTYDTLLECCSLLGRYILPVVYLHYMLPRIRGDKDILESASIDSSQRIIMLEALSALIEGTKPCELYVSVTEIVTVITDAYIIDMQSLPLVNAALHVLVVILTLLQGKYKELKESSYLNTGRLSQLTVLERQILTFIIPYTSLQPIYTQNHHINQIDYTECNTLRNTVKTKAFRNLLLLSKFSVTDDSEIYTTPIGDMKSDNIFQYIGDNISMKQYIHHISALYKRHMLHILLPLLESYEYEKTSDITTIHIERLTLYHLLTSPFLYDSILPLISTQSHLSIATDISVTSVQTSTCSQSDVHVATINKDLNEVEGVLLDASDKSVLPYIQIVTFLVQHINILVDEALTSDVTNALQEDMISTYDCIMMCLLPLTYCVYQRETDYQFVISIQNSMSPGMMQTTATSTILHPKQLKFVKPAKTYNATYNIKTVETDLLHIYEEYRYRPLSPTSREKFVTQLYQMSPSLLQSIVTSFVTNPISKLHPVVYYEGVHTHQIEMMTVLCALPTRFTSNIDYTHINDETFNYYTYGNTIFSYFNTSPVSIVSIWELLLQYTLKPSIPVPNRILILQAFYYYIKASEIYITEKNNGDVIVPMNSNREDATGKSQDIDKRNQQKEWSTSLSYVLNSIYDISEAVRQLVLDILIECVSMNLIMNDDESVQDTPITTIVDSDIGTPTNNTSSINNITTTITAMNDSHVIRQVQTANDDTNNINKSIAPSPTLIYIFQELLSQYSVYQANDISGSVYDMLMRMIISSNPFYYKKWIEKRLHCINGNTDMQSVQLPTDINVVNLTLKETPTIVTMKKKDQEIHSTLTQEGEIDFLYQLLDHLEILLVLKK